MRGKKQPSNYATRGSIEGTARVVFWTTVVVLTVWAGGVVYWGLQRLGD